MSREEAYKLLYVEGEKQRRKVLGDAHVDKGGSTRDRIEDLRLNKPRQLRQREFRILRVLDRS